MSKEALTLLIGRIVQAGLALVALKLLTHYLSPTELGAYYIVIAISGYFSLSIINPVGVYFQRHIFEWKKAGHLNQYLILFQVFFILAATTAFLITPIIKISSHIIPAMGTLQLIILVALYVYFSSWFNSINVILNIFRRQFSFVITRTLSQIFALLFSLTFIFIFQANSFFWLSGQILSFILLSLTASILIKKPMIGFSSIREASHLLNSNRLKDIMHFSWPLMISAICMWILGDGYRVIAEPKTGIEYIGTLSVGFAVAASCMTVVESVINQLIHPFFFEKVNSECSKVRSQTCQSIIDFTTPIFLVTTIFISINSPFLIRILTSIKYLPFYHFVILGACIQFFRVTTSIFSLVGISEMNNQLSLVPYAVGAASVILGLVSASTAPWAVPLVLLVSAIITFMLIFKMASKKLNIHLNTKPILKTLLVSLPFFFSLSFYDKAPHMVWSFIILSLNGLYFAAILLRLYRRVAGHSIIYPTMPDKD